MAKIHSAKPWKVLSSKHTARTDRPKRANTVSPVSKGYGKVNRNPSGDHLTPDHVGGFRGKRGGTAVGVDRMQPRSMAASRNSQGDAMSNSLPKAKAGKSGAYTQK